MAETDSNLNPLFILFYLFYFIYSVEDDLTVWNCPHSYHYSLHFEPPCCLQLALLCVRLNTRVKVKKAVTELIVLPTWQAVNKQTFPQHVWHHVAAAHPCARDLRGNLPLTAKNMWWCIHVNTNNCISMALVFSLLHPMLNANVFLGGMDVRMQMNDILQSLWFRRRPLGML